MDLEDFVRDVPDFPSAGILFKDITPLLADHHALSRAVQLMAEPFEQLAVSAVLGIEARGFLFGPAIARHLQVGFVPIRKAGKLPPHTVSVDYSLEYGTDRLEMRSDSIGSSDRVLLVDDVLATGGTLHAAAELVEQSGATTVGISVLIELLALSGRKNLPDVAFMAPIEVH